MYDNKDALVCPVCGNKMEKIFLEKQKFHIDICLDGCGGIFLDNQELKKIDQPTEDITPILAAIKDKKFKRANEHKTLTCPVCSSIMIKNKSRFSPNTTIDECYSCGGVFLNNNELFEIRQGSLNDTKRTAEFEENMTNILKQFLNETYNEED